MFFLTQCLTEDTVAENLAVSCGFYNIIVLDGDASLNLRLELGIFHFGEWEEWNAEAEGMPGPINPYGIFIYPVIVYSPDQTLSFQLRSLISPVDVSGILIAGMNWSMYQGFALGFMATAMFRNEDDLFGCERDNDPAFILSVEYFFGE